MTLSPAITTPAPANPPSGRATLWAALVIFAATLIAYFNSFATPFIFDDRVAVIANTSIQQGWLEALNPPSGGQGVTSRPVMNLSLALNYAIGGLDPFGYHVANWLIHLLAALTLLGVVRRTCELPAWRERLGATAVPLGFLTALLWAVHPLQTETVTCVVQRNESLMALFYLVTLYCFVRGTQSARPRWWWGGAVAACLLGMASKEVMASAPLLVLLYDRTFVAGSFAAAWRARRRLYGALAGTWAVLALLMAHGAQRGGTVGFGLGMAWWAYALKQCQAIVQYLWLSVWPHPLVLDYGTGVITDPRVVAPQIMLLILLGAGTLWALVRRPWLGFLGAWVFVILAPSSSVLPLTTQTMAEHRMYLPLAALAALAALGLWNVLGRRALAAGTVLAGALVLLTFARNHDYRNETAIYGDSVAKDPDNDRTHMNYGSMLGFKGRLKEGEQELETALRLNPDAADSENNLGNTLLALGEKQSAYAHYQQAVKLLPDYPEAYNSLGQLDVEFDRAPAAIADYQAALRARPDYFDAQRNLGIAYAVAKEYDLAVKNFLAALALRPDDPDTHCQLGNVYVEMRQPRDALAQYMAAIRANPDFAEAHYYLGNLLVMTGNPGQAIPEYEAAVRAKPDDAAAYSNLAFCFLKLGQPAAAIQGYQMALRLDPGFISAQAGLDRAKQELQQQSNSGPGPAP
jgi:protein O-mannosyl-transferase